MLPDTNPAANGNAANRLGEYSSLYHLRNFRVDRIKIDRTFVEGMNKDGEDGAIVRALLGLGHGLGVKITAEGVDSARQRDTLISEGSDQGQGALFSRALPANEAAALFQARVPELRSAG